METGGLYVRPTLDVLSGFLSRRITDEHKVVYHLEGKTIQVAQARYRYE